MPKWLSRAAHARLNLAVLRLRGGDQSARNAVFTGIYEGLTANLSGHFAGQDERINAALDVVEEFVDGDLAKRWDPSRGDALAYAARIAFTRNASYWRKQPKLARLAEGYDPPDASEESDPAAIAERNEARAVTRDEMTPGQREVADLLEKGWTFAEIEAAMGITTANAKRRFRTRKS